MKSKKQKQIDALTKIVNTFSDIVRNQESRIKNLEQKLSLTEYQQVQLDDINEQKA